MKLYQMSSNFAIREFFFDYQRIREFFEGAFWYLICNSESCNIYSNKQVLEFFNLWINWKTHFINWGSMPNRSKQSTEKLIMTDIRKSYQSAWSAHLYSICSSIFQKLHFHTFSMQVQIHIQELPKVLFLEYQMPRFQDNWILFN